MNLQNKKILITNDTNRSKFHEMNPKNICAIRSICVIRDKIIVRGRKQCGEIL